MVLTILVPDRVLSNLQHKFHGDELASYHGLYLIPYLMFQESENWKEDFIVFANLYLEDFSDFNHLASELELWYNFWNKTKYKNNPPDSISATLKRIDALAFPNRYLALKLLGT